MLLKRIEQEVNQGIQRLQKEHLHYFFTGVSQTKQEDSVLFEIDIKDKKKTDFTFAIDIPLTDGDDTPTFYINRFNPEINPKKIELFARNMNDKLEAITKDAFDNWIYEFLDLVVRRITEGLEDFDEAQFNSVKHDTSKIRNVSSPEIRLSRLNESRASSSRHFIPYPCLQSITWSPFGTLTVIRNTKFHRDNFNKRSNTREIYTENQLNNYYMNCERKTQSYGNLDDHHAKEYLIEDDEENENFYTKILKNEEEISDYLNMQISIEKKDPHSRQESTEEAKKDDYVYGQNSDYVHYSYNEIPELQRRIGNLQPESSIRQHLKNRFDLQLKFRTFDIEQYVTTHTEALSKFLARLKFEKNLRFSDDFLERVLETLFHDYKEYKQFKYWHPDPMELLKREPSPLKNKKIVDGKAENRASNFLGEEKLVKKTSNLKPFYKNLVNFHLLKEIFAAIFPKSRYDEKFSKVALVALLTEIVLFRNHFKQLLSEILKLIKKSLPHANFLTLEESLTSESEIDFKLVLYVHQAVQELLEKTNKIKRKIKQEEEEKKENKRKYDTPPTVFIFGNNQSRDDLSEGMRGLNESMIRTLTIKVRKRVDVPRIDSLDLIEREKLKSIRSVLRACSELFHRKGNYHQQIFVDNILNYHKNLSVYITELKEMLKALLDIEASSYYPISDEEIAEYRLQESNFLACSVCSFKTLSKSIICSRCLHGGHQEHLEEWFSKNDYCPECLRCKCAKLQQRFPKDSKSSSVFK